MVLQAPAAHQEVCRGLYAEAEHARAERDGRWSGLVRVAVNRAPFVARAAACNAGEDGGAHAIAPARSPWALRRRASASARTRTVFATERFSDAASPRTRSSSPSSRNWTEIDFPKAGLRFLCATRGCFLVFLAMPENLGPLAPLVKRIPLRYKESLQMAAKEGLQAYLLLTGERRARYEHAMARTPENTRKRLM